LILDSSKEYKPRKPTKKLMSFLSELGVGLVIGLFIMFVLFGILLLLANPFNLTNFPANVSSGSIIGVILIIAGTGGLYSAVKEFG
jgi:hypothetical protein